MFGAILGTSCTIWAGFKQPSGNFQALLQTWAPFVGNLSACRADVKRQASFLGSFEEFHVPIFLVHSGPPSDVFCDSLASCSSLGTFETMFRKSWLKELPYILCASHFSDIWQFGAIFRPSL